MLGVLKERWPGQFKAKVSRSLNALTLITQISLSILLLVLMSLQNFLSFIIATDNYIIFMQAQDSCLLCKSLARCLHIIECKCKILYSCKILQDSQSCKCNVCKMIFLQAFMQARVQDMCKILQKSCKKADKSIARMQDLCKIVQD